MSKLKERNFSISIATPFFNEETAIDKYFGSLIPVVSKITKDWEIICVDDGSIDSSKEKLKVFCKKYSQIKLISFSRNFGKEAALTAAIDFTTKDVVIPIDADLQDPPEVITELVKKWREGYDVVLAVRKSRKDSFIKNLCATLFHKTIHYLTNKKIPKDVGDFRAIDRKVVNSIKQLKERNRFMKGVFSWVGYKTTTIYFDRPARSMGESKLSFFKLLRMAFDGIVSFSTKPLKVWLYVGLSFSIIAFVYACFLVLRTLIYGVDLPGYASIMVAILFMGGIQLVSLGVIGEYIARIFKEVKQRPIYIVDEIYGFKTKKNQ